MSALEAVVREVLNHCEQIHPHEAVGVLSAGQEGLLAHRLTNVSVTPNVAFEVSAREWIRLESDLGAQHRTLYALYHSHPDGLAELSAADRRLLVVDSRPWAPNLRAWVIALRRGRACSLRSFCWANDGFFVEQNQELKEIESRLFRKG